MHEIMMIRNDGLKILQVDDSTIAKLTKVRGNLYRDDPRLRVVKDLPTPKPKKEITPEMQARAEAAFAVYMASRAATAATPSPAIPAQSTRPLTPDEEWRTRPDIRAEFVNLASYTAYMRAVRDRRCRAYGGKS